MDSYTENDIKKGQAVLDLLNSWIGQALPDLFQNEKDGLELFTIGKHVTHVCYQLCVVPWKVDTVEDFASWEHTIEILSSLSIERFKI